MALRIDALNFDCAVPKIQAQFWAEALGFEFKGEIKLEAQISLGGEVVNATEEGASVKTGIEGLPRIVFVKVPEGKVVKNRVHLDINAESVEEMRAEVARLVSLGASMVQERSRSVEGRKTRQQDVWTVMQDPEGNEFCVGVEL